LEKKLPETGNPALETGKVYDWFKRKSGSGLEKPRIFGYNVNLSTSFMRRPERVPQIYRKGWIFNE